MDEPDLERNSTICRIAGSRRMMRGKYQESKISDMMSQDGY